MKMMRNTVVALSLILLSAPMISGQDLSKYRTFSLGTCLAELSKQIGPYSHYTTLIHQRPAAIQELTFWTLNSSRSRVVVYPVSADFVQLLQWRAPTESWTFDLRSRTTQKA